ncbi:MAG: type II toxin-antitoxin system VapC family toxin [Planctomycetes bacterium]|nr:type II toxin-antitoxin system VapC family toxin [Planctomycetota bacterium]
MFILDSDHLSILQRQAPTAEFRVLADRMAGHPSSDFFVTIVSFHEQVNGWRAFVARAKDSAGLVRGYAELEGILSDFARAQVLPFSTAAAHIYDDLRKGRIRVGPMDLRIASIAIAHRMTVLTRNTVDFERVPNLLIEDWTRRENDTFGIS